MDEQTLIRTYEETIEPLYRFVSGRCGGDRGLAEDVVQETWLRAVDSWKRRGPPDQPLAWLKTVARNLLANYWRRVPHLSLEGLPAGAEAAALTEPESWSDRDHSALVGWALARLRPAQARLLEAFHLEGHPVSAIAAEMGLSERAVEGRLRRARVHLRKHLERVVNAGETP